MRNLVIFAGAIALAGQASAANLLANGSFESGLSGWTLSGASVSGGTANSDPQVIAYNQVSGYPTGAFGESVPIDAAAGNPGYDAVGTHGLYFSSDYGLQTLSQSVTLAANTEYTFGFDYYLPRNGYNNPNNALFSASVGGENITAFSLGSVPATTWTLVSGTHTFTTGGSGEFDFSFQAAGYTGKDIVIDRVFLARTSEVTGVPEVGTWAMMLVGFGAIGAASRRRRTSLTFG